MWVADMDLECPEFVVEALRKKADQKIFGYTFEKEEYIESLVRWIERRHGYKIEKNRIAHAPTVVTTLNYLLKTLSSEGNNVLIQTPTYPQFVKQVKMNNRNLLTNELIETENSYKIDFTDFEEKLSRSKVFILCNPHNPSGRVWTEEELKKMGELCEKYNVKIISDEIHSDLIITGKHLPFGKVNPNLEKNLYTCYSTTKTFNLAGIQSSFVMFPNTEEKINFVEELSLIGVHEPNSFCMDMVIAAYSVEGEEWLKELKKHLESNIDYTIEYINKNIPKIKVKKPEATYLMWLDMREFGLSDEELNKLLVEKGKLALNMGKPFMGEGFARMNVACPRYMLEEGLDRLKKSFQ
jgi:cystathionine beta-lyase